MDSIITQDLKEKLTGKKEMPLSDFLRECSYWALRFGFEELRPYPFPTRTAKVNEYFMIPQDKKARLEPKYFQDNPEIDKWAEQYCFIFWRNKYNLEWLKEIKGHIPEEDILNHKRLDERINEFSYTCDSEMEKRKNTRYEERTES